MVQALPPTRQPQLLANSFAAAEKLEKSAKRLAPVLKNQKTGVLLLNWSVCSKYLSENSERRRLSLSKPGAGFDKLNQWRNFWIGSELRRFAALKGGDVMI